ncbi:MAG: YabP/YqfC family sporulation protein [Clostridia bacterium]|nr:YabP/YqfC family sporulation protein [Clostridia bacterium]
MSFIDDIKNTFGDEFLLGKNFRCTLFSDAGYFENVCSIAGFSEEEIILSLKGGRLTVKGKNLYIKKYCGGDVAICGKITELKRD